MFAGTFPAGASGGPIATSTDSLLSTIDPYSQADASDVWRNEHAHIVATHTWNTAESRTQDPILLCRETNRVLAAWVRLDNRQELIAKLERATAGSTDHELLLWAFERWDTSCVQHLIGAFCFVVYEPGRQRCFLARDQMGFRPLYYSLQGGMLNVATTAAAFHGMDHVALEPSQEWMARYLLGISTSHTDLPWPRVHKLAPAHTLEVDAERFSAAEPRQYFAFENDQAAATTRSDSWVDEYRSVLHDAVRARLRTNYRLGCETSGGIDSSTCLALAAKFWPGDLDDIHSFGFLTAHDEPEMVPITGDACGIKNEHLIRSSDRVNWGDTSEDMRARIVKVLGYPQEIGNGSAYDPFYRICQANDVRTLLSGFGGDEGVTNSAPQLYDELIDERRFLTLVRNMHGSVALRPLRTAKALKEARRPEQRTHMRRVAQRRFPLYSLRPKIAERYDLERAFEDNHRYVEGYSSINGWVLGERLANPFVPTRLENCVLMAHSRKVEYRWPLLDIRLVQQFLSTPAIEKRGPGFGRYLHRRAIDDVVPHAVAWKPSKDMGEPLTARNAPLSPVDDFLADMHPRLVELVDRDQVRASRAGVELAANPKNARFVARREHRALRALDVFLKQHHA